MKKFVCLALAVLLAMTGLMTAAFAYDDSPSESAGYYYVYTENGKTLNVRDTPGGKVVGHLKYGDRIYCYYKDGGNGWALIDYDYDMPGVGKGTYACYISSRFLVKNKPAPRPKKTDTTAAVTSEPPVEDTLAEINAEFASAKKVTPFKVTVRPTRASGWVNLRWAPSKSASLIATYPANSQLLVIKETTNWFQVEDQDTGDVGLISKQFVSE